MSDDSTVVLPPAHGSADGSEKATPVATAIPATADATRRDRRGGTGQAAAWACCFAISIGVHAAAYQLLFPGAPEAEETAVAWVALSYSPPAELVDIEARMTTRTPAEDFGTQPAAGGAEDPAETAAVGEIGRVVAAQFGDTELDIAGVAQPAGGAAPELRLAALGTFTAPPSVGPAERASLHLENAPLRPATPHAADTALNLTAFGSYFPMPAARPAIWAERLAAGQPVVEVPQGLGRARVFIHHSVGKERPARALAQKLTAAGVASAEIRQVDFEITRPNIRFYHEDDFELAREVLATAQSPLTLADFTHYAPAPVFGTVEFWIME